MIAVYAVLALAGTGATPRFDPASLQIWRKADAHGRACASCHSPDGIELAAFNFPPADLTRRVGRHFVGPELQEIIRFLVNQRSRLRRVGLDPMECRPFQPGGSSLPGETAAERDLAFGRSLVGRLPALMGPRVATLADAQRVRDEVLGVDLQNLKIGIPFNRLSEDGFHGKEHASLASWLPDVPLKLTPAVIAAQNGYLASPNLKGLGVLDSAILAANQAVSPIQRLAIEKYRSLLRFQHELRVEEGLAPAEAASQPTGSHTDMNPFWEVAEVARTSASTDVEFMGLPKDVADAKTSGASLPQQMTQIRVPWYWAGWIADPSLQHSGPAGETRRADYFTKSLLNDGPYPIHCLFMLTKKQIEQGCNPRAWSAPDRRQMVEIEFSFLLLNEALPANEPKNPEAVLLFRRAMGNAFRTLMYLELADVKRTGAAIHPESQRNQVRIMESQLERIGEPESALATELLSALSSAAREGSG